MRRPGIDGQDFQISRRRVLVEELYVKGVTQNEIAAQLTASGLKASQKTVSRDVFAIHEEWKTARIQGFDEHQAKALAKVDHHEAVAWKRHDEAMAAFRRSREVIVSQTSVTDPGSQGAPIRKQATEQKKRGPGDAAFLNAAAAFQRIALEACSERSKLLGTYAPKVKVWRKDEAARRLASIMGVKPEELPM